MATARAGATAVALSGRIYVIGGHDGTTPLATVEEYDPATDTWTTKTSMNVARNYPTGVILGDLAYVIGGTQGGEIVETYDPTKDE